MKNFGPRLALCLGVGLAWLRYNARGPLGYDDLVAIGIQAAMLFPMLYLPSLAMRWLFRRRPRGGLSEALFTWPSGDVFTLRHLLTSIAIFGMIGSGKSSAVALQFARVCLGIHNSSGIIFASNPDDLEWWTERFREAGREGDLIVFSPTSKSRWNFLADLQKRGADALAIKKFLVSVSEVLVESRGNEDLFWKLISERILECAIRALMMAGEEVSAPNLSRFFSSAAYNPAQLKDEPFLKGYFNSVMKRVNAVGGPDAEYISGYWFNEFLYLDERPRSSALSAVGNLTHLMSVGLARECFSTTTNASRADLQNSKWILMDFPISRHGPTGKLIYSAAKAAVQAQVLANSYKPGDPITILFCDEAWHVLNRGDREFLSESRKHGGSLIFLSQSVNNYYIALGGGSDHSQADALLGQFGSKIFCACDYVTADFAVKLVGEEYSNETGGSFTPSDDLQSRLAGGSQWTSNFNRKLTPLMRGRQFSAGLRMGSDADRGLVDFWVHRPELYRDGTNIQIVTWRRS